MPRGARAAIPPPSCRMVWFMSWPPVGAHASGSVRIVPVWMTWGFTVVPATC